MLKKAFLLFWVSSSSVYSNDDVVSIDSVVPNSFELAFPNESNIQPKQGDFEVNGFTLMSNSNGERWAVVTLKNLASGNRNLTNKHLLGLVANGERIAPIEFVQSFKADETLSLTVSFGESKFPLLSVYTRPKI